jgi:WD40 repeat protein
VGRGDRRAPLRPGDPPAPATFAGVAADGTVHAWRSDDCREVATLSSAPRAAWMPWLVAGGGRALVLRHGRVHTLADPRGAAAPTELDLGAREPLTAAASPDGAQWTIVGREGLAVRRDARTGADLGGLAGLAGWVTGARYAPDGATLLTLGGGHAAHLWRAADGAPLARLEIGDTPVRAAFSADGERLLVADARGRVGLWDVATREFAGTLARLGGQPLLVAFSADDADALLAGPAGVVRVPATAAGVLAASAQAE